MPFASSSSSSRLIEIEALRVRRPDPFGKHAGPCDREAVGLRAQRLHQANVFLVAMIMVVGDVGIAAGRQFARRVSETVPDRRTASVLVHGAFDLIGRGGRSPSEVARKAGRTRLAGGACRLRRTSRIVRAATAPAALTKWRRENPFDTCAHFSGTGRLRQHKAYVSTFDLSTRPSLRSRAARQPASSVG